MRSSARAKGSAPLNADVSQQRTSAAETRKADGEGSCKDGDEATGNRTHVGIEFTSMSADNKANIQLFVQLLIQGTESRD